jgi:hypothetical protein
MPVPEASADRNVAQSRPSSLAAVTGQGLFPVAPNTPFVLVHHPNTRGSWEAVDYQGESIWLPTFVKVNIDPGANGISTPDGNGAIAAASGLLSRYRQSGAVVLDSPADIATYLSDFDCEAPKAEGGRRGLYFHERWVTVRRPMPGRRAKNKVDHDAHNAWRVALVRSGRIPEPHPDVIETTISEYRARLARLESLTNMSPTVQERLVNGARKDLDRIKDAEMPENEPAAAPPPKAPKAPKAPKPAPADGEGA